MEFHAHRGLKKNNSLPVRVLKYFGIFVFVVIIGLVGLFLWFNMSLSAPTMTPEPVEVVVEQGETLDQIVMKLELQGVIKSATAMKYYVRLYHADDALQAGSYTFDKTESSRVVISRLISGDVAQNYVTIIPASRLSEVERSLIERGYSNQAVQTALKRSNYNNHPLVVEYLPDNASLEGYLYPETYATSKTTDASEIIASALDAMYQVITPQMKAGFAKNNLTTHEAVILASIVENEVGDAEERRYVAQVFITRLQSNIALESNATDDYPADYNTYEIAGLPPGPLTNVSKSSLEAVANPASSDYLYFVTGNDCKTRFSRTLSEHESLQRQHGVGCTP